MDRFNSPRRRRRQRRRRAGSSGGVAPSNSLTVEPQGGLNDHDRDPSRIQSRRSLPRRLRPQRDRAGRARDARPHGDARRVRSEQAPLRGAHLGLPAHDGADGRPHRDPDGARRRGALGQLQHLLHPGPRRGGHRRRARWDARGPEGRAGLRLEGRVPRGVLVVHRAGAVLARRRPDHDPRRRRRRHDARPQGRRGREVRLGAGPGDGRLRGAGGLLHPRGPHPGRGPAEVDLDRQRHQGGHRGDDDRRPPPLRDAAGGRAPLPRHQRQRLRDEVQVRQQVRLPPLAHRRHQPRDRRADRRQGGRRLRVRRRREGLRRIAGRAGRPRRRDRDRPDLRAAGGHGGLRGHHPRGRASSSATSSSRRPATATSSRPTTWRT